MRGRRVTAAITISTWFVGSRTCSDGSEVVKTVTHEDVTMEQLEAPIRTRRLGLAHFASTASRLAQAIRDMFRFIPSNTLADPRAGVAAILATAR